MKFDNYIFDMDGTLWDAVDSYCRVWNHTIDELAVEAPEVKRPALADLMGMPLNDIYNTLIGNTTNRRAFMTALERNERDMMPALGGRLYHGTRQTLQQLREAGHKLFMVSNCQATGLPAFLKFTKLGGLFTDTLSYGQTGLDKDMNIRSLVERYKLVNSVYIGDTQGDCRSTHAAGLPFVWAAYGFGKNVADADYVIHNITELIEL